MSNHGNVSTPGPRSSGYNDHTSTMTRSMSRKGLSSTSHNFRSNIEGGRRESSTIEKTAAMGSKAVLARRRVLSHVTASSRTEMNERLIKPITSTSTGSTTSGMRRPSGAVHHEMGMGMGVQPGPPVVKRKAARRTVVVPTLTVTPAPDATSDPFSMDFDPPAAILRKRTLEEDNLTSSPAKRINFNTTGASPERNQPQPQPQPQPRRDVFRDENDVTMTPRAKSRYDAQHGRKDGSEDDDIDFLSPRKSIISLSPSSRRTSATTDSGRKNAVSTAGIRSPERPTNNVTSVQMSRSPFVLPASFSQPRSTVTLSSPVSAALPSKFTGVPSIARPPTTSNPKSMIPQRAGPVLSTTTADVVMDNVGNASVGGGMSEETAKRLTNLQAMLSKLSMPRASMGGRAATTTVDASLNRRRTLSSMPTAMLPPSLTSLNRPAPKTTTATSNSASRIVMTGNNTRRKSTMTTGSFLEEYSVPISDGDGRSQPRYAATTVSRSSNTIAPSISHTLRRTGPSTTNLSSKATSNPNPKSARRTSLLPTSSSTAAISSLASHAGISGHAAGGMNTSQIQKPKHRFLRDVIAYVDIRTLEGNDAGMIFVDLLKDMSAKVATRPTPLTTHIIYKSGRPATLAHYRGYPDPKPFLVGIGWVVRCAELGERVDERPFLVEEGGNKEIPVHKRRKSMEPKAIAALSGGGSTLTLNRVTGTDPALKATISASLDRARRKSLQFTPKVGSPLAKRVFTMIPTEEEADHDDDDDMSRV